MMPVVWFRISPVNPVEDIETPISPHEKNVISRQVLHLSVTLQHNQLRQNSNTLQINRKRPQQLNNVKPHARSNHVSDTRYHATRQHREFPMKERILRLIVRAADGFLVLDHVYDGGSRHDVQHFHT